ncbi:MAG: cytochrome c biogenesis protein CcsA [Planctomycetaceae bacterium]|nr:cytochrome c biogenesis protein CcsA [Planctomycetaceae bacterium]
MFLSGISIVCFGTSYLVTLVLEISRLFFRLPVRLVVMLAFAAMGLALHTIYLLLRAQSGMPTGHPLSSWHDWYLMAAWILAAAYLIVAVSRPQTLVGLFMLPVVLALVGVAALFKKDALFPHDQALALWGFAHGLMLLLGTVTVSLGFVAGLMYLVQSWRLKHKVPPQAAFKLPSLEWLQSINKQSLAWSSCFIALGLVAGIVMNVIKYRGAGQPVPWTDSVVLSSAALLVWLIAATIFEWVYKPAQQGRKVAYLTVASFIFLACVMAILVVGGSQHAAPRTEASSTFNVHRSKYLDHVSSTLNLEPGTWNFPGPLPEGRR